MAEENDLTPYWNTALASLTEQELPAQQRAFVTLTQPLAWACSMFDRSARTTRPFEHPGGLEAIMWEVHVLRQLRGHDHIVKLCDVVELAAAKVAEQEAKAARQESKVAINPSDASDAPFAWTVREA